MKYKAGIFSLVILLGLIGCGAEDGDSTASGNSGGNGDGGSTARFAIQNGFLVTLEGGNQIHTYELDSTNGATRNLASFTVRGGGVETLRAYESDKLLLGTQTGSLVLRITDNGDLYSMTNVSHARSCDPVIAVEQTLYITLRNSRALNCGGLDAINHLHVWDIANLRAPALRASIPLDQPYGLSALDDTLYVCTASGLVSFDISNRWAPQQTAFDDRWLCDDIIARDGILYLTRFEEAIRLLDLDMEPLSILLPGE